MRKSKKEVSLSAYLALELKYKELRETTKELRAECRNLRKKIKALKESRANWKDKAVEKNTALRDLERRFLRYQKALHPKGHHYPTWLVTLVVILRVYCHSSYGSIQKIVKVLQTDYFRGVQSLRVPCEKTLQNWVSKVGYFYLKNIDTERFGKEVALILDESIRVSSQKLFLALLIPLRKQGLENLSFEDVEVFHLEGAESWTGDKIADRIRRELSKRGLSLKYVVSDEGNNLKRAIKLLEVPHIPDISHAVATCLKKTFKELEDYKDFSASVNLIKAKLGLCEYSFLRPPKQRTKSRFLNQEKIVNWAEIILERWDKIPSAAQEKLAPIKAHQEVVAELKSCILMAKKVAEPLKTEGLNLKTINEAIKYTRRQKLENLENINENGEVRYKNITIFIDQLMEYLERYKGILIQNEWQEQPIHICSDVIERLFGCYKAKLSDNFFVTASSIALEIPLMCLKREDIEKNIQVALESVSITNLTQWRKEQNPHNQTTMRAKFFKK